MIKKIFAFVTIFIICCSISSCGAKIEENDQLLEQNTNGKYTAEYTENIKNGNYMTTYISQCEGIDECYVELIKNNENFFLYTKTGIKEQKTYIVDKVSYTQFPAIKYCIKKDIDQVSTEIVASELKMLDSSISFEGSEISDGSIVEHFVYDIDNCENSGKNSDELALLHLDNHITRDYYFDMQSKDVEKIVQEGSNTGHSEIIFKTFKSIDKEINIPEDIETYKVVEDYNEIDEESLIQLILLDYGVSDNEVKNSEYSYEDILKIYYEDYDEFIKIVDELKKQLNKNR